MFNNALYEEKFINLEDKINKIDSNVEKMSDKNDESHKNVFEKIETLQKFMWVLIGAVSLIGFLEPIILSNIDRSNNSLEKIEIQVKYPDEK